MTIVNSGLKGLNVSVGLFDVPHIISLTSLFENPGFISQSISYISYARLGPVILPPLIGISIYSSNVNKLSDVINFQLNKKNID